MIAAPLFHAWGFAHMFLSTPLGSTLVLTLRFEPEQTLRVVSEQRAEALIVVPVMLQRILELPDEVLRRYDISSLVSLLHDDAVFNMPPYEFWIQGPQAVHDFMYGHGIVCEGSRTIKVQANGMPAFASYHAAGEGVWKPWSIVVLDVRDGRIAEVSNFLYPELFEAFGLPPELTL